MNRFHNHKLTSIQVIDECIRTHEKPTIHTFIRKITQRTNRKPHKRTVQWYIEVMRHSLKAPVVYSRKEGYFYIKKFTLPSSSAQNPTT